MLIMTLKGQLRDPEHFYLVMSACDSEMLKSRFKKRVAFVSKLYPKRLNKVHFACHAMSYLAFFTFCAHNAICVAYCVFVSYV